MNELGEQYLEERPSNPYYQVIDTVIEWAGYDPADVAVWLHEHQETARLAADSVTVGRAIAGHALLGQYKEAVENEETAKAVFVTLAYGAVLATDFIDGWIANTGGVGGQKRGKVLDSVSDVALRLDTARAVVSDHGDDPLLIARYGGEALVASHTGWQLLNGEYQATILGKAKVNCDAVYVVSDMLLKACGNKLPPKIEKALRTMRAAGQIGGLALSYADGIKRWVDEKRTTLG